MYEEERARILQMVAEGALSPAQASDLLAALEMNVPPRPLTPPPPPVVSLASKQPRRYLVIEISSRGGESTVNLRIPLGLARTVSRFIPRQAQTYLNEHEINLEALLEGVGAADESGTLLEVINEGGAETVRIAVE